MSKEVRKELKIIPAKVTVVEHISYMKDEIDISQCLTFDEIYQVISNWTNYYNNDRYQWDLARLSPNEYYKYRTSGLYPLTIPKAKGDV
jgi:hypothetical protein